MKSKNQVIDQITHKVKPGDAQMHHPPHANSHFYSSQSKFIGLGLY